jgi:hypothetical protein
LPGLYGGSDERDERDERGAGGSFYSGVYVDFMEGEMSVTAMLRGTKKQDEWMTPPYAVRPLLPYLKPGSSILCPFDKADSAFAVVLIGAGHKVHTSHIRYGKKKDFFRYEKEAMDYDYIISNPPYSVKDSVFERLLYLDRPFAMLMGATAGLFEGKRFDLFERTMPELLWLKPRVAYIDPEGRTVKSPPFQSCYVCKGVLPRKIMFARLNKEAV